MKKTGDKVSINGEEYELGAKIGGGQEGSVFDLVGRPNFVIKLINTTNLTPSEKNTINEHLYWLKNIIGANKELTHKLAIPKGLVDNDVGYVMVKARTHDNLSKYIDYPENNDDFSTWFEKNYELKKRLQICAFMFRALEQIHISGLLFTDLSPNNIMVNRDKNNLFFIDTDNMRRKQDAYLGVLGTPGYMAPEIYNYKLSDNDKLSDEEKTLLSKVCKLSVESDIFSAAIIAFKLLTLQHPFIGDEIEQGDAEGEDNALKCATDYILKNGTNNVSTSPLVEYFHQNYIATPELNDLFYKTFVDGKENPYLRPSAIEFSEAFDRTLDKLAKCSHCSAHYVFNEKQPNVCWKCDKQNENPIVMYVYDRYSEANRDTLVSKILDMDDDLIDMNSRNDRFMLMSTVVLQEKVQKFVYKRHFEKISSRDNIVAIVLLNDKKSKEVSFKLMDSNYIGKCMLIDRRDTLHKIPISSLDTMKCFSIDDYAVLCEINNSRVGEIRTLICFK